MTEGTFITVLLSSDTFWSTSVVWGLVACALVLIASVLVMNLSRVWKRKRRLGSTEGAAAAVDVALTFPLFFAVTMLAVQFAVLAADALVVHYAAYSAARSARVVKDPYLCGSLKDYIDDFRSGLTAKLFQKPAGCEDSDERIDRAARLALIAAAPATTLSTLNTPSQTLKDLARLMAVSGGETGNAQDLRYQQLLQKITYAFHPGNLELIIDEPDFARLARMQDEKSIFARSEAARAKVTFYTYVWAPGAYLLIPGASPRPGYNFIQKPITAEVSLI